MKKAFTHWSANWDCKLVARDAESGVSLLATRDGSSILVAGVEDFLHEKAVEISSEGAEYVIRLNSCGILISMRDGATIRCGHVRDGSW